jgi:Tfp pilus assembly protein PilF
LVQPINFTLFPRPAIRTLGLFSIYIFAVFGFDGASCAIRHQAYDDPLITRTHYFQDPSPKTDSADQTDVSLQRARDFLHQDLFQDAELTVRKFLVKHANSAEAHFLLGYILFKQQKVEASLAEYTEGAKYHDPDASDLKIVALNYVLLNDYLDADRWLTRSVEADPKDSESWYYLGRTKYNENRFDEAVHAFEECLRLDPKNGKAQANLGLSLEGLGRFADALAAYRRAIAQQTQGSPKSAEPFIDLGNLLLQQDQTEDAIVSLLQAAEISPQEPRAHESLGKAYLRTNRLSEAQAELEKAIALVPDSASSHYLLGQVYRKKGLMSQAKAEFDRAVELNAKKSSPGTMSSKP